MLPSSTTVLIVGAGPTGLVLATTLAQAGIDHLLIERRITAQNTSRAAVIHAQTLEVLENLGVAEQLTARGLKVTTFGIYDRDRPLIRTRFDTLPTRYPHLLMLSQDVTEAILTNQLQRAGGIVHRGYEAKSIAQTANHVSVSLTSQGGEQAVAARYVVGADGMHSIVREAADIPFTGAAYAESFLLTDVVKEWGLGPEEVRLFFSPAGLVVVAPLPEGRFRIVASAENAPEHPTVSDVESLLNARGPRHGPARIRDIVWSSRFRIHHRLADHYRRDRLFLAGDAAHVHSPAGGQGMNTGVVDAWVLGRILSEVVSGRCGESFLDEYQSLRRPAAAEVLRLAGRLTEAATMKGRARRAMRNLLLSTAGRIPMARRRLAINLSGLNRRKLAQVPVGSR